MSKILFIAQYPLDLVPSQRFRFEQYLSHLNKNGFEWVTKPFFTSKAYYSFYQSGNQLSKIRVFTVSYIRRLTLLFKLSSFDFIFIHREATPLGPPIIEYVISKVGRKKMIYDFDDAIWLTDRINESSISSRLRFRKKVGMICRWSHLVCCGNNYLAAYARTHNDKVVVIPTTIDTGQHTPMPERSEQHLTVGWTGSHSTLKYLKAIIPVLQQLAKRHSRLRYIFIADKDPRFQLENAKFLPWRIDTEIQDLARIDIGIMPLPDDPWTRGKCGFKALQYMAMGIPAVLSPVGVNSEIVEHGVHGYFCETDEEWLLYLEELICDAVKRKEMGQRGRKKVIEHYSVAANVNKFLSLFQ